MGLGRSCIGADRLQSGVLVDDPLWSGRVYDFDWERYQKIGRPVFVSKTPAIEQKLARRHYEDIRKYEKDRRKRLGV